MAGAARSTTDYKASGTRITWQHPIHLLTNRFAWFDTLRVVVPLLVGILVSLASVTFLVSGTMFIPSPTLIAALFGILFIPFILIGVFSLDTYNAHFELNVEEVIFDILPDKRPISKVARIFAPVAGGWRAFVPALYRVYPETMRFAWVELYKLTFFRSEGVITLSDSWRSVIRLYIADEYYDQVKEYCLARLQAEESHRTGARQKRKGTWFYLGLTALCCLALAFSQSWQWAAYENTHQIAIIAAILAVFLVYTWLAWWSNFIAVVCLMYSAWYLAVLVLNGLGQLTGGIRFLVDIPQYVLAFLGGVFFAGLSFARFVDKSMNTE